MGHVTHPFDVKHVLHELRHYLPAYSTGSTSYTM